MANSSAPLLSLKSVHLIFNFASGISKIGFISRSNSLKGSNSLAAVDSDIYFTSVVDMAISICKRLNHVIGQPINGPIVCDVVIIPAVPMEDSVADLVVTPLVAVSLLGLSLGL